MKADASHYPVKRKGQRRRLDPNREGALWLEDETRDDTEIDPEDCYGTGELIPGTYTLEFKILRAEGYFKARRQGHYARPMFETFGLLASSSNRVPYPAPCPDCDDWSRTSRCTEHHDRDGVAGLRMGEERRRARSNDGRPMLFGDRLLELYTRAGIQRSSGGADQIVRQPYPTGSRFTLGQLQAVAIDPFRPHTLEITGDTVQAPASTVQIEVEGTSRDD